MSTEASRELFGLEACDHCRGAMRSDGKDRFKAMTYAAGCRDCAKIVHQWVERNLDRLSDAGMALDGSF